MTENDILQIILERLGYENETQAIFNADEIAKWKSGTVELFCKIGMLQKITPATHIECDGCEENCFEEVIIYQATKNKPAKAFIACGKRDDIGRVDVDINRLNRWQTSGGLIAEKLTELLNLKVSPIKNKDNNQWTLGMFKGKKHSNSPVLIIKDSVFIELSGHPLPLIEILTIENGKLLIEKQELNKCVDNPKKLPPSDGYKPSTKQRDKGKIKTLERDKSIFEEYIRIKKINPNNYDKNIVWEISKLPQFKNVKEGRIGKIIREHKKMEKL